MASNKVSFDLTLSNILARMNPGRKYTCYHMAHKFKCSTEMVRPKMLELLKVGAVSLIRDPRNNYYTKATIGGQLEIVDKDAPVKIADGAFEVAGHTAPPDLKSNLKGYDAQFSRFQSLCMATRRYA